MLASARTARLEAMSKSGVTAFPASMAVAIVCPSDRAFMKAWPPQERHRTSTSRNGRTTSARFSPPSINHGVLAIGLVVFPDCHDREARRDKENRRVKHEAQSACTFRAAAKRQLVRRPAGHPRRGRPCPRPSRARRCRRRIQSTRYLPRRLRKRGNVSPYWSKVAERGGSLATNRRAMATKRLISDQATNDGKTRDQDLDRACSRVGRYGVPMQAGDRRAQSKRLQARLARNASGRAGYSGVVPTVRSSSERIRRPGGDSAAWPEK